MVGVLLDTCVLAELRRPQGGHRVRQQVDALDPEALFLSVVTVGELANGVALLPEGARRRELAAWLVGMDERFADQILPVDAAVAHVWGELTARAHGQGPQIPASDGLIAATALHHGLRVMTRNTKHFAASGAPIIDPWTAS